MKFDLGIALALAALFLFVFFGGSILQLFSWVVIGFVVGVIIQALAGK